MSLLILSFLAGALTIVSPCVLPIVPFLFARPGQNVGRSTLPMLAGLALSFTVVASLASVGGQWVVRANDYGRVIALSALALTGVALLLPSVAERLSRPLVALGDRLTRGSAQPRGLLASVGLGAAVGLLWTPCAGPVLGLVLTGAAIHGASSGTTLALAAYAAGAAVAMALALWVGQRALRVLKRALPAGEWLRRGVGAAVLAAVAMIALGLDTQLAGVLPGQAAAESTRTLEQSLIDRWLPAPSQSGPMAAEPRMTPVGLDVDTMPRLVLPVERDMPPLDGALQWLNSPPLDAQALRGKVVLVDFWTFACINCQHALPYVRQWAEKYKDQGLVVIGVHAPEFAFERDVDNVRRAAAKMGLNFPIAIDNDFRIWNAFSNNYWPANYFIDARGRIRYHHFGEGAYEHSEQVIRQLLQEAKAQSAQ